MAPRSGYLPLLPSGPHGVHSFLPHRARSSTPPDKAVPKDIEPRAGTQPRYSGFRVQGTANSPPSTTQSQC